MTQNSLLVVLNNLISDVLGIPIHLTLLFSFYLFLEDFYFDSL